MKSMKTYHYFDRQTIFFVTSDLSWYSINSSSQEEYFTIYREFTSYRNGRSFLISDQGRGELVFRVEKKRKEKKRKKKLTIYRTSSEVTFATTVCTAYSCSTSSYSFTVAPSSNLLRPKTSGKENCQSIFVGI